MMKLLVDKLDSSVDSLIADITCDDFVAN